jgi:cell division protein FtsA
VVLTGGSSRVRGLVELAEEVFHMPVRIGTPQSITGLGEVINNPVYSTSVGLLLFGRQHISQGTGNGYQGMGLKNTWTRIKNWFTGNF